MRTSGPLFISTTNPKKEKLLINKYSTKKRIAIGDFTDLEFSKDSPTCRVKVKEIKTAAQGNIAGTHSDTLFALIEIQISLSLASGLNTVRVSDSEYLVATDGYILGIYRGKGHCTFELTIEHINSHAGIVDMTIMLHLGGIVFI
jgi:hypothetical protein